MAKADNNFKYCKGIGCPLRDRCIRYREGTTLPEGNWWWQYQCAGDHEGFLPVAERR